MDAGRHHPNKHRLEKAEQTIDLLSIALVVGLGIAMLVGLITASGHVTW